jgi:bacterioferritin-associated ferredoxin
MGGFYHPGDESVEIEIQFQYTGFVSALAPTCESSWLTVTEAPAMTRCECTGITFAEVERRVREEGLSVEAVSRHTGCGGLCTACVPDLKQYLASRR